MESQVPRTQGHHYESSDLHSEASPEGEGHHEKTSVMQKVKAKARKIKNTLTKHGHDHDHDEEDEDEEMVEEPEIHGAPGTDLDRPSKVGDHPTTGGTDLDRPSKVGDPHYDSTKPIAGGTNLDRPSLVGTGGPHHDSTKPIAGGANLDRPSMVGDPHYDSTKPIAGGANLDRPSKVGDPHYDSTKPIAGGANFDRPSLVGTGGPHHDSTKPAAAGTSLDRPSMLGPHHDSTKPAAAGTNLDRPSKVGDPHYDSTKPIAGGTNFDRPSLVGTGGPHHDSTKPAAAGTNLNRPSMVGPHHDSTKPAAAGTNLDRPSMLGPHHDSTKPAAAGTNLGRPSKVGDPHYDSTKPIAGGTNFDRPSLVGTGGPHHDSTKPAAAGTNLDRPSMLGPHSDSPIVDPETRPFAQWQEDEEHGKHLLKEDKHAPLPCKLVDSRSGEDMYSELPHKGINTRTGRDVDEERKNPDQTGGPNAMEGIRGGIGTTGFQVDPQGPNIRAHPSNAQVKTIDPAGRGSEEVEGITPVTESFNKMGISEEIPKTEQSKGLYTGSHDQFAPDPKPRESSDSVPKSYNAANPQDVPGDEGLYTGSHDQFAPDPMPRESSESVPKSYNAANPQDVPGDVYDPARNSSTYTGKITSASAAAASAIAGTAQSAKNVIASKMGTAKNVEQMREPGEGNKTGSVMGTASDHGQGNKTGSVMGTASDYAHRIAATVTDTLAPVYGKVVGVGSGASSKVPGLGAETTQESGGSAGQDKGVSVTENWVEKLKPGEEDRALSSMITESFGKPKGEKMEDVPSSGGGGGRSISQIASDAVHKREPEESESEERKPMGKVTESKEVAKRLGTGEEGSGLENVGSGAGVVSKLTGAIGSWLGGQGGRAHSTPGTTLADDNEGDTGKNADAQESSK